MYEYDAYVTKVYDGDTITVDIDLGFEVWLKGQKLRLIGIDTPEVRGPERPEGILARDALRSMILNKKVRIKSYGRGKYGRWLSEVFIEDININQRLLAEGFARPY